jgi:UPF0716 protein FxsA
MKVFFLILLLVPAIEIAIFIQAGAYLGTGLTLLLILVTAVIGVALIRQQGLQTLFRAQQKMAWGEVPAYEMLEGLLFAIAGICLLTPGFFTDGIGFLILIPPLRRAGIVSLTKMQGTRIYTQSTTQSTQRTIEGEFKETDKDR